VRNQYKILAEVYNNKVNEATRANLPGMQNYMDKHGNVPFGQECATVTVYKGHITEIPPGRVPLPEDAQWLIKPSACYVDTDASEVNVYILDPHIITQIVRYNIGAITLDPNSEDFSEELYNYLKSVINAVEKLKDNTIQERMTRANLAGMQQFKSKVIDTPWDKPALLLTFDKNGEFLHSTAGNKLVNTPEDGETLYGLFKWIIPNVAAAMIGDKSGLVTLVDYTLEVYVTDPDWINEIRQLSIGKVSTNPNSENYSAKAKNMWDQLSGAVQARLQEYRNSKPPVNEPVNEATRANLQGMQNYMKNRQEIMEKYVAAADEFWKIVEVLSQISQMPEAIELTKEIEGGISQGDEPQSTDLEYKFFNAFDRLASNNLSVGQHISPYDYIQ
jgi:hypothetical protein